MKNKIIIGFVIIFVTLFNGIFGYNVLAEYGQKGDVNGDNKVSVVDLSILKRFLTKQKELTIEQQNSADINGDGKVSIVDLSILKKMLVGIVNRSLTEEEMQEVKDFLNEEDSEQLIYYFFANDRYSYRDMDVYNMCDLAKTKKKYKEQEILKMYNSLGLFSNGKDIFVGSINDLQLVYKKFFDVDLAKEDILALTKREEENNSDIKYYYIEDKDLIIVNPNNVQTLNLNFSLENVKFENGIFIAEYEVSYQNGEHVEGRIAIKEFNDIFYFEGRM